MEKPTKRSNRELGDPGDTKTGGLFIPKTLAIGLILFLSIAFVRHLVLTLPFPYPVEYGEGVVAGWIEHLGHGLELYPQSSGSGYWV